MQSLTGNFMATAWGGSHGGGGFSSASGIFAGRHGARLNYAGHGAGGFQGVSFDNSRQARTSSENRPKNIAVARFAKMQSIDWRTVPARPKKLAR